MGFQTPLQVKLNLKDVQDMVRGAWTRLRERRAPISGVVKSRDAMEETSDTT